MNTKPSPLFQLFAAIADPARPDLAKAALSHDLGNKEFADLYKAAEDDVFGPSRDTVLKTLAASDARRQVLENETPTTHSPNFPAANTGD